MNYKALILAGLLIVSPHVVIANDAQLKEEIRVLQQQTQMLQAELNHLQHKVMNKKTSTSPTTTSNKKKKSFKTKHSKLKAAHVHNSVVSVKSEDGKPESVEYNPVALIADGHVVTYIGGVPVVTSPYLGAMPAFDGSDYIVNISSINRDIRLMQQRRRLYGSYERMGYPVPNLPIVAISGKVEPMGTLRQSTFGPRSGDWNLGSSELDVAAALNDKVEGYLGLAYDDSPPSVGPRVSNSALFLNMGFVNIGDLDESPFYFTAGQLYVPFGRFSTAMISSPLPTRLGRTRTRPFILGYKSQKDTGPFAAIYAYKSDTILGNSAVGGLNLGYIFNTGFATGEFGGSIISSLNDAGGLQITGSNVGTTFGGFGSFTNGSELVHKIPGVDLHGNIGFDRYNFTAEWVSSLGRFHEQDLSFNGVGAAPQALQLEAGATFMTFDKPSSIGLGYQWSKDALALNMPEHRLSGVYNISIWKDTIESLEYRHDINYGANQFANGAAPPGVVNENTIGGGVADTLLLQIGVYF